MRRSLRLGLVLVLATPATADDWPCWRGPRGDGVSAERGWSSEGRALWSAEVGLGHSSCVIVGPRVWTFGFDERRGRDAVRCLDADSGALRWEFAYPATLDATGHSGGTLTTPAVGDGVLYLTNRVGAVRALDAETGRLLWERDLRNELGVEPTSYGFGGSPVLAGNLVLVAVSETVALARADGSTVWRSPDRHALYATPTLFALGTKPCAAAFTREGLSLFALADGAELASFPWSKGPVSVNASSPVGVAPDRLFISSAYDHGGALVDFSSGAARAVWESKVLRTKLSGAVLHAGYLWGFDESQLKCVDLDGRERWRKRGLGLGALSAADGRLIVLSEEGELVVLRATPERYEELARERVLEGGVCWSTPVLADGRIYCRNGAGVLVCRDHRASAERED